MVLLRKWGVFEFVLFAAELQKVGAALSQNEVSILFYYLPARCLNKDSVHF